MEWEDIPDEDAGEETFTGMSGRRGVTKKEGPKKLSPKQERKMEKKARRDRITRARIYDLSDVELSSGEIEKVLSTPSSPQFLETAETREDVLRKKEDSLRKKLLTQLARPGSAPPPTPKIKSAPDIPMGMYR